MMRPRRFLNIKLGCRVRVLYRYNINSNQFCKIYFHENVVLFAEKGEKNEEKFPLLAAVILSSPQIHQYNIIILRLSLFTLGS